MIRLKEELPVTSPDPVVAKYAQERDAILISFDNDFKQIAKGVDPSLRGRFKKLSRIHMQCDFPGSERRMAAALSLIEFEWIGAQSRPIKTISIVIQKAGIKTHR